MTLPVGLSESRVILPLRHPLIFPHDCQDEFQPASARTSRGRVCFARPFFPSCGAVLHDHFQLGGFSSDPMQEVIVVRLMTRSIQVSGDRGIKESRCRPGPVLLGRIRLRESDDWEEARLIRTDEKKSMQSCRLALNCNSLPL
jgi:hypothetical protein